MLGIIAFISTPKMDALGFSETFVINYKTARIRKSEDQFISYVTD